MTYEKLKKLVVDKYGELGNDETAYVWPRESIDPGSWDKYLAEMEKLLTRNLPKAQFGIECAKLFGKYGRYVD